jgi:hypothetical protein
MEGLTLPSIGRVPNTMRKSLTKSELAIIADLLALAAADFNKSECEEYTLPPSDENKEILLKALEKASSFSFESDVENILFEKDELLCESADLMAYFAERCKKLSAK